MGWNHKVEFHGFFVKVLHMTKPISQPSTGPWHERRKVNMLSAWCRFSSIDSKRSIVFTGQAVQSDPNLSCFGVVHVDVSPRCPFFVNMLGFEDLEGLTWKLCALTVHFYRESPLQPCWAHFQFSVPETSLMIDTSQRHMFILGERHRVSKFSLT